MNTSVTLQGAAQNPVVSESDQLQQANVRNYAQNNVQSGAPQPRSTALQRCMRGFANEAKSFLPVVLCAGIGAIFGGLPGLFIGASLGGFALLTWWLMTKERI